MDIKSLSPKQKSFLKKRAANRILAGFGFTRHSFTCGTTYGFSFDNFMKYPKCYDEVQNLLDNEGIKYSTFTQSYTLSIKVSYRKENLEKFIALGERVWKKVLDLYLPMIDELEKIQENIDSRPLNTKRPTLNYIVSRKCFADYYRTALLEREIVDNYENEIEIFTKLVEVQNDIEALKKLYRENKSKGICNGYNPGLAIKLEEEYERLTGETEIC